MATKSFTKTIIISDDKAIDKLRQRNYSKSLKMQKILSEIKVTPQNNSSLIQTILKKY